MGAGRRRALLIVRAIGIACGIAALANPARVLTSGARAVVFVLDHSKSLGEEGVARVVEQAKALRDGLDAGVEVGFVTAGETPTLIAVPGEGRAAVIEPQLATLESQGAQTNYASAVVLAQGLFPAGVARNIVVVGDGEETAGSLEEAARQAALSGVKIHALAVAGDPRPDVRVVSATPSKFRASEGAAIEIEAVVESSVDGEGRVRLFENGIEVERMEVVSLKAGEAEQLIFKRTPPSRKIYTYRVVAEGFSQDAIPENNEALAIVDVRGKPLFLYVEGDPLEAAPLQDAMNKEGLRLEVRPPSGIPRTLREFAGYDGVILSDVPAHVLGEQSMEALRDYVEKLGGGLVMIGGENSFGVGGYYRTPIADVLPVKLKSPDQEESQSSALALVLDRSGSMAGQKMELCKSAAAATAEILTKKDFIGVYAFDSQVHVVVPMTRVTSPGAIAGQIATLTPGGGTNVMPGMTQARLDLSKVKAKLKHMIVLTDGQTSGDGYEALASQCRAEGITISTVAIGGGSQVGLLQRIASAGGGTAYATADPAALTRIFTQDTLTHTGRMIREEPFEPVLAEAHPMLREWDSAAAPPLLGYVKTIRRLTAQMPLATDTGDPLLAHWRFGLGKATAFTSDAKSRWAALWISGWPGYSQFWGQVLRETGRPPQGQLMDLELTGKSGEIQVAVDLLEDAASFKNNAAVKSEVFFLPPDGLGGGMQPVATSALEQDGPGRYTGQFTPEKPGVYLVRARSGARTVSAGIVHNPSTEGASGTLNLPLLEKATATSGGALLASASAEIPLGKDVVERYSEFWPWLVAAMLVLFFIDLVIRRWENVLGVVAALRDGS